MKTTTGSTKTIAQACAKQSVQAYKEEDWESVINATLSCPPPVSAAMQTRYQRAWKQLKFRSKMLVGALSPPEATAVSNDGDWAAVVTKSGDLIAWDVSRVFEEYKGSYSPKTPDVAVHDLGEPVGVHFWNHEGATPQVEALAVNTHGDCYTIDLTTSRKQKVGKFVESGERVWSIAASNNGSELLVGLTGKTVLIDIHSKKVICTYEAPNHPSAAFVCCTLSSCGHWVIAASLLDEGLFVWDRPSGRLVTQTRIGDYSNCISIDRSSTVFVVAQMRSPVSTFVLPSITKLKSKAPLVGYDSRSIVLSADGLFAISSSVHNGHTSIWEVQSGEHRSLIHAGKDARLALAENQQRLLIAGQSEWTIEKGYNVTLVEIPEGIFVRRPIQLLCQESCFFFGHFCVWGCKQCVIIKRT